ncbi:MAG TPA: ABC transporter ATP-binding protein [Vicinamibacterales bacterium]|nr:ABC transporter ATP-binding protein [Vicinamibacterales bacterium]
MIQTHGLRRDYGKTTALHELTLQVGRGEILGFLGPNGAGKSTTVKILAGMLKPTAGRATVAGFDVATQPVEVKRRIGYVPEAAALYEALTAREYLQLVAALHHQPFDEARRRIAELLDQLDLSAAIDQRLGEFSKGMKQKVLIASALLHRPEVVFFDEPLTGLDANAALVVKELIRSLAAQGRTIFFCSHVLEVVERVCTRIVIIDKGRVVADGTAAAIAAQTSAGSLEAAFIALTGRRDAAQVTQDLLRALGD